MPVRRALIALALALAFNLFAVQVAQAIEWTVEGEELINLESGKESITSSGEAFEITVPTLELTIKCKSQSGKGTITEKAASSNSVTLTGCTIGEGKVCTVKSPEQSTGTLTATLATSFVEKEISKAAKTYDEVKPTMTVETSGALCSLPKTMKMAGATAAAVPKVTEAVTKRSQKFSKSIAEEAGLTSMTLGEKQAFFTGEDSEQLSGAHSGQQVGTLFFWARPRTLAFTGTGAGNSKTFTTTNLSNTFKIKIIAIDLFQGNYTINEPMTACKGNDWAAGQSCTTTVICNATPNNPGKITVEADQLNAGGTIINSDARDVTMTC
jgi:hypothetical protein